MPWNWSRGKNHGQEKPLSKIPAACLASRTDPAWPEGLTATLIAAEDKEKDQVAQGCRASEVRLVATHKLP